MAKPTEVKKVAQLLDQDAESSEDMAKKVWELVEQLIADREQHVAVVVHPSVNVAQAVGPYATVNQLMKDYKKRVVALDDKSYAFKAQLISPGKVNLD